MASPVGDRPDPPAAGRWCGGNDRYAVRAPGIRLRVRLRQGSPELAVPLQVRAGLLTPDSENISKCATSLASSPRLSASASSPGVRPPLATTAAATASM